MKDKITIGLFNDSFYPMTDGVINVVDNYARLLSKRANVIVFVPSYPNNYYDDTTLPYKVVRCKSIKIPFLDYSLPMPKLDIKFLKELKKYNLDIVHIHSPFTIGATSVKYAKKHNIPCIATMHSQFKKDIMRFTKSELASDKLLKEIIKVFNSCDECFAVNKEVARIFYEDYHCKKYPHTTEVYPTYNVPKQQKEVFNNIILIFKSLSSVEAEQRVVLASSSIICA